MKLSNLLTLIIWLLILSDAVRQGVSIPGSLLSERFNQDNLNILIIFFPFVFFLVAAFIQRGKLNTVEFVPNFIASRIDKKYGRNTTNNFLIKLKPIALFMCAVLLLGLTGLFSTYTSTKQIGAYNISLFFLSGGLGLLSAHILSIFYPPRVI